MPTGIFDSNPEYNLCVFSLYFSIMRLNVCHYQIASLRLNPADLIRMNDQLFEWRMLDGTHHDHTLAERQLGMFDFPVLPFDNELRSKTECIAKPFNHRGCIAIRYCWHYSRNIVRHVSERFTSHSDFVHFPHNMSQQLRLLSV